MKNFSLARRSVSGTTLGRRVESLGMKSILIVFCLAASLAACSSSGGGPTAEERKQEDSRQQHDCADPQWKAAHLGLWYSVCRPNVSL